MLNRDDLPEPEPATLSDSCSDKKVTASTDGSLKYKLHIIRLFCLVVLGICGAFFYLRNEHQVFPAASIDLQCSKPDILKKTAEWGKRVGYDKTRTIESIYFSYDAEAKTFLEYELGTARANALMMKEIPVWCWRTRICQEFQNEEFKGSFSPTGDLLSLYHDIPNDRAMPSMSQDEARTLSHDFVEKQTGISLARYKCIEKSSNVLVHRTDHSFVFQDESKDYNGAHPRVSVGVSGKSVSYFSRYLYVPEKWDRKFSTVRTNNYLLRSIADVFSSLIGAAACIAFVLALSTGNIRWRFALTAGAVFAFFGLMESLNNFNTILANYDTSRSYTAFILQYLLNSCLEPFGMFIYGAALAATGEYLYRLFAPEKPALENVFSFRGLRSKSVLLTLALGYVVFGTDLGWAAVYYLTGYKFGYWCPLGVDNYKTLSTFFPFISAMNTGLMAATVEEILYRVAGLGLIQRLVKNFWIANFLQALIWGFMHSHYPQQPCYARGIELTLGGMFYGWIYRRYGLLPCFISHYLYDAYCGVRPLLSAGPAGWTAAIPFLPFALLALGGLILVKRKGGFVDESEIANRSIPVVRAKSVGTDSSVKLPFEYAPLSGKWRAALLVGAVLACACMAFVKAHSIENSPVLKVSRHEAVISARQSLERRRLSHKGMREVVSLNQSWGYSNSLQYIFEKSGFAKTAALDKLLYQGYVWNVRFFRAMEAQEYQVGVSGSTGKECEFSITREEDAAGATVSKEAARKLCEDYVRAVHPEYCPFAFDSATETKRKNRTDHCVTLQVPGYKVGEADFKVNVNVVGDMISSCSASWSLPSKWTFEYYKSSTKDEIVRAVRAVLGVISMVAIIWWAVGVVMSGAIRWRQAIYCAIPLALLDLVSYVDSLPQFYRWYATTTPMPTFISTKLLGYCGGVLGGTVGYVILFSFSLAVLRLLMPQFSIVSYLRTVFLPGDEMQRQTRKQVWLDAILITYCFSLIMSGKSYLVTVLSSWVSPYMHWTGNCSTICSVPDYLNYLLSEISVGKAISYCFIPLLLASIYSKYVRKTGILFLLVFLYALLDSGTERYWQEFLVNSGSTIVGAALIWILVTKLVRTNALTYFLAALVAGLLDQIVPFVKFGTRVFLCDTIQLIIFVLLPLAYLSFLYFPRRSRTSDMPQSQIPEARSEPGSQDIP